jgi:hypothetical protein
MVRAKPTRTIGTQLRCNPNEVRRGCAMSAVLA